VLFLKFQIGVEAYVLDTAQIAEVLPLVNIQRIPKAPAGIAGLFDYRGTPVPVIDLSELALGRPAQRHLSTRLVVVRHGDHLLGVIAEQATETIQRDAKDFAASGVTNKDAPYLGPVTRDGGRLIQWIEVHKLLPAAVISVLYRQGREEPWPSQKLQPC
jgi:chemotaxis-related protein WspB